MQAAIDAAYAAGRACAAQVEDLRREMEEAKRAAEAFSNHCQSLSPYRLSLACSSLAPVLPPSGRLPPVSSLYYPSTRPSWPGALRRCDTPAPRWGCPAKASPIRACGLRRWCLPRRRACPRACREVGRVRNVRCQWSGHAVRPRRFACRFLSISLISTEIVLLVTCCQGSDLDGVAPD